MDADKYLNDYPLYVPQKVSVSTGSMLTTIDYPYGGEYSFCAEHILNFLRRKKNIVISVDVEGYNHEKVLGYFFSISSIKDGICNFDISNTNIDDNGKIITFETYEEAMDAGIRKAIELLREHPELF